MKKTKVMSIIAMVLFILALFSQVMYTVMYLIGALSSIDLAVSAVAKVLLTSSIPTIVSLVLMIVGVRLAASSKNQKSIRQRSLLLPGFHCSDFSSTSSAQAVKRRLIMSSEIFSLQRDLL